METHGSVVLVRTLRGPSHARSIGERPATVPTIAATLNQKTIVCFFTVFLPHSAYPMRKDLRQEQASGRDGDHGGSYFFGSPIQRL